MDERDGQDETHGVSPEEETLGGREARRQWAALIRRVFEVDPLVCAKCSPTMRVIAFIERSLGNVIEQIIRHCGL